MPKSNTCSQKPKSNIYNKVGRPESDTDCELRFGTPDHGTYSIIQGACAVQPLSQQIAYTALAESEKSSSVSDIKSSITVRTVYNRLFLH